MGIYCRFLCVSVTAPFGDMYVVELITVVVGDIPHSGCSRREDIWDISSSYGIDGELRSFSN